MAWIRWSLAAHLRHIQERTRSVLSGVTTQSVGTIGMRLMIVPMLRVGMPPVTLRVTDGTDCGFSEPGA